MTQNTVATVIPMKPLNPTSTLVHDLIFHLTLKAGRAESTSFFWDMVKNQTRYSEKEVAIAKGLISKLKFFQSQQHDRSWSEPFENTLPRILNLILEQDFPKNDNPYTPSYSLDNDLRRILTQHILADNEKDELYGLLKQVPNIFSLEKKLGSRVIEQTLSHVVGMHLFKNKKAPSFEALKKYIEPSIPVKVETTLAQQEAHGSSSNRL